MRALFVLFVLVLLAPSPRAQWTIVPTGTTGTLRVIANGSAADVHMIGDGGYVAVATSPFDTWTPINIGTSVDLHSLVRISTTQIWISGVGGVVRVRNPQNEWRERNLPTSAQQFALFSRSSGVALAAGSDGSIWNSDDLGVTWELQASGTTVPLHAGIGGTSGDGFVVGDGGLILKSTDNGATWTPLPSGTTENLYAIQFTASRSLEAVGAGGVIVNSEDAGTTWTTRESGTTATLRAISTGRHSSASHLVVGDNGTVLRSTDNGTSWCALDPGVSTNLRAALMANPVFYLVAGDGGTLVRTETGTSDGCTPAVSTEPDAPDADYALSALWPNPVRTETALTVRVDRPQRVTVTVLNLQGRQLDEAFAGEMESGTLERVTVDASGLAAGSYIVRVQGETFTDQRQMTVIR